MKWILFALFLTTTYNTILSMHAVTLPPKKEIYERLYNLGWKHFLRKTKIHKHLGFKHVYAGNVVTYVKIAIQNYNKNYAIPFSHKQHKRHSTSLLTQRDQATIITALFKSHPHVLTFLEENDVLQ